MLAVRVHGKVLLLIHVVSSNVKTLLETAEEEGEEDDEEEQEKKAREMINNSLGALGSMTDLVRSILLALFL